MALIGYARVSTIAQSLDIQLSELRAAGCEKIHTEKESGAKDARPILRIMMASVKPGDVIVVVRTDRLARSLVHLLSIIKELQAKGCGFKSLRDPIDTTSAAGLLQLQVMGAVAEFERNLLRERTMAGMQAARERGKKPGNPGLIAKDPAAIRKLSESREGAYLASLEATSEMWLPLVQALRPHQPWHRVTERLNKEMPKGLPAWSQDRLIRAVKRLVKNGLADASLLKSAQFEEDPDQVDAKSDQLMRIMAGIKKSEPNITLRALGDRMRHMGWRAPRGGEEWKPGTVSHLLHRAVKAGVLREAHLIGRR